MEAVLAGLGVVVETTWLLASWVFLFGMIVVVVTRVRHSGKKNKDLEEQKEC